VAERLTIAAVIGSYNHARYVGQALESVLGQSRAPDQVVVVDDGSTDDTPAVLAPFSGRGVVVLRQDNAGPGAARNAGVAVCTSDLVAFLDADDLWTPGALAALEAPFLADPDLDIAFGGVQQFRDGPDGFVDEGPAAEAALVSNMAMRRSTLTRHGLFPTDWHVEFAVWFLRARDHGLRDIHVPELVARRRLHAGNRGLTVPRIQRDYVLALKEALDRRRAMAAQHRADA
jgi:glycosyltransferase involved in cell wall biosynthesis